MSSEAPPQPVSDAFNYRQWNQSTGESATQAWATRRFLSKLFNDVAAGIISFVSGIKTNLITTYSNTVLTIGENDNTKSVSIWYPTLANSKPIASVNNTTLASTEWVNSWFSYIRGLELTWSQLNTYTTGIETNLINGSNLSNAVNLYSTNNQQGNLNILNFDYPTSVARPNVNIACGVSNDLTQTKSQVNILTGSSYGSLSLGGTNTTCRITGITYINSNINEVNGVSILSGNCIAPIARANLDIMTSTNIDPLSVGGNVRIQNGTSNGKTTIGNSLSSIDLKAGTMTLYNPFTPNYSYPIGVGKIGYVFSSSYNGGLSSFTTGTSVTYGSIIIGTTGLYLVVFQSRILAQNGSSISQIKAWVNASTSMDYGDMYGIANQFNLGTFSSSTEIYSSSCAILYHDTAVNTTYSALVQVDFTGSAPTASNGKFMFKATRIA